MIDRKIYEKEYMGKIVSDEEIINFLQNENRNLKKENAELKAQIDRMKCCGNCNNLRKDFDLCLYSGGDKDYFCRLRKWELAE